MRQTITILVLSILTVGVISAATASAVNISSVTVSSGIATVSCGSSNCAINSNYGFCITGTSDSTYINVCRTALTGTGGTSFTFNCGACSNETLGASGTVIPARQLICLSTVESNGYVTFQFLLWITTTNGVVNPNAVSAWATAGQSLPNTPTGGYLAAIQAGTTIERQYNVTLGDTAFAKANAESIAQNEFLTEENQILGSSPGGSIQPGQYYAQYCDPVGCSF